jgi:hypothetical protein
LDPEIVSRRLSRLAELADLRTAHRLDGKIDYSADAVTRRLRSQAALSALCRQLARR